MGRYLVVVPSLKITFLDGNGDLVLHYMSHTVSSRRIKIRGHVLLRYSQSSTYL